VNKFSDGNEEEDEFMEQIAQIAQSGDGMENFESD
jgi:hypothetical protein